MALNVGSTQIGYLYVGNTIIDKAYYGSTKIYQYVAPQNRAPAASPRRDEENKV